MLMNDVINNYMMISEKWIWMCDLIEAEDNTHLRPTTLRDKGIYKIPLEGDYILPMDDLVY